MSSCGGYYFDNLKVWTVFSFLEYMCTEFVLRNERFDIYYKSFVTDGDD